MHTRDTPLRLPATLAILLTFATLLRRRGSQSWVEEGNSEPWTLVFRRQDLQKIWEWEIGSGRFSSYESSAGLFLLSEFNTGIVDMSLQVLCNRAEKGTRKSGCPEEDADNQAVHPPIQLGQVPNASTLIYPSRPRPQAYPPNSDIHT
jgi:hypothetical protein